MRRKGSPASSSGGIKSSSTSTAGSPALKRMLLDQSPRRKLNTGKYKGENPSTTNKRDNHIVTTSPTRYSLRSTEACMTRSGRRKTQTAKYILFKSETTTRTRRKESKDELKQNIEKHVEATKDVLENKGEMENDLEEDKSNEKVTEYKASEALKKVLEFAELKNSLNSSPPWMESSPPGVKGAGMEEEEASPPHLSDSLMSIELDPIIPLQPLDIDEEGSNELIIHIPNPTLPSQVSNPTLPTQIPNSLSENKVQQSQKGGSLKRDGDYDDHSHVNDPTGMGHKMCTDDYVFMIEQKDDISTKIVDSIHEPEEDAGNLRISNVMSLAAAEPKTILKHGRSSSKQTSESLGPVDLSMNNIPMVTEPSVNPLNYTSSETHKKGHREDVENRSNQNRLVFKRKSPRKNTMNYNWKSHKNRSRFPKLNPSQCENKMSGRCVGMGDVIIIRTPSCVIPVINDQLVFQENPDENEEDTNLQTSSPGSKRKSDIQEEVPDVEGVVSCGSSPENRSVSSLPILHTCHFCHMGFTMESDWLKHQRRHGLEGPDEASLMYYCNRCPTSFHRHRDWVNHRKTHITALLRWQCDKCDINFSSRRDLREHRFRCEVTSGRHEPAGDIQQKSSSKFECKICHKAFPYPSALRVHQETHILKHKCPVCSQTFTRFYEMTKHVRAVHPDVSSHACDHCGKVFDRLTILYRHKADGLCTSYQAPEAKPASTSS